MTDFLLALWSDYGAFLLKTVTLVLALVFVVGIVTNAASRQRESGGELQVTNLSKGLERTINQMKMNLLTGKERKALQKEESKKAKAENKGKGPEKKPGGRLFVVDFNGSIDAKEVESLRREVTAILAVAEKGDEVLLRLESGGGVVHGYGLAAAQLKRLRDQGIRLTISVDKVAASGGYMMACIADEIVAAPFAMLGSIGVLAQIPNFHRLLKKNHVDFEQVTAGEYKRTLTLFGENTEKGREKFKEELENIHTLFKGFVKEHRPDLDIDAVATGEVWFGQEAVDKGLTDRIGTSDDLLLQAVKEKDVIKVQYKPRVKLGEKLAKQMSAAVEHTLLRWWQNSRFYY
ncbi:protease SohB [Aliidiomarina taiwanensis]|uniref:Protease SohB n=1 Tax=Aliidiomarina taiwanensis TaxID=946228 RepID=A0A432WTI7_9GAMM|nr:protease SohB [Aliidiomarina taiwanensis]RUO37090.1 protease SohB [Aliidiomarina taiwanensis]